MPATTPLALVQDAYAAFGRGDIPGLLALLAPDVRWEFTGDSKAPYTGRFRGHGQVGEWFQSVAQADGIQAFEPREFLAGPDHVTVLGWERTQALPGGGVFECEWVHIWQASGGRLTRFWGMLDTEAAARARR
ncbi:nuclear transport factor 2 family protein [Ideonella sp.]|uniref:nuclear transport factor 2 family protein n=1 Tax=Ideonella sp. TaxID=1929293 RepID=UPI002B485A4E|nr:nuclear transport factor 2 family protein [Ideonella sp.]HJV68264.1 nuclear transport factor 2 family protein [Ideonella sp.]